MSENKLSQCEMVRGSTMETREVICLLVELAREMEDVVGEKGAVSIFRHAGKRVGKRLGKEHGNGAEEDARSVALSFFHAKGFMDSITLDGHEAEIQGCKIGLVLQEEGLKPGSHPLCHFGFGLIDGSIKAVTDEKVNTKHQSSVYHAEGITCRETW